MPTSLPIIHHTMGGSDKSAPRTLAPAIADSPRFFAQRVDVLMAQDFDWQLFHNPAGRVHASGKMEFDQVATWDEASRSAFFDALAARVSRGLKAIVYIGTPSTVPPLELVTPLTAARILWASISPVLAAGADLAIDECLAYTGDGGPLDLEATRSLWERVIFPTMDEADAWGRKVWIEPATTPEVLAVGLGQIRDRLLEHPAYAGGVSTAEAFDNPARRPREGAKPVIVVMDSEPAALANLDGSIDRIGNTFRWMREVQRTRGFEPAVAVPFAKLGDARGFLGLGKAARP